MINTNKYLFWGRLISFSSIAQLIIQGTGFLSGIILVRSLSIEEYAFYTIANTVLATIALFADGGVSVAVMSQGGKVWSNREKLGCVINTGKKIRNIFSIISLSIGIPVLIYLLYKNSASYLIITLISLSTILVFLASFSGGLLEIPIKLSQDFYKLQKTQAIANLIRLSLIWVIAAIYPIATLALLCGVITQLWSNSQLKKISKRYADDLQLENKLIRIEILKTVKRILPSSMYYAISGQFTMWLVAFYGSTTSIAQIGAISRIALVFNIIIALSNTILIPKFSCIEATGARILAIFIKIQLGLLFIGILSTTAAWVFSDKILLILGESYIELRFELFLIMVSGAIGVMSSTSYLLPASRGVIINPIISIFILIIVQICGLYYMDVSTIIGVIEYSILFLSAEFFIRFFYYVIYLKGKKGEKNTL